VGEIAQDLRPFLRVVSYGVLVRAAILASSTSAGALRRTMWSNWGVEPALVRLAARDKQTALVVTGQQSAMACSRHTQSRNRRAV
jgi:hypothetical protein